ncbi:hypothetical protein T492DRAFT_874561 [Pavlovales sp. CCMP2436]|nr:hypothetical protein T492DRAFT_874561 [Pavlovales sp. CCMP2436]
MMASTCLPSMAHVWAAQRGCELAGIPARQIVPVINRSVEDSRSIIDALEDERRWFRDWELKGLGQDPAELSADVLVHAVDEAARCAMLRVILNYQFSPFAPPAPRVPLSERWDWFVGFDEHALVLRRFGCLKEQLIGRVTSALAQDTALLREFLRHRSELICTLDIHGEPSGGNHIVQAPDVAVKHFIVQLGDSHILFSRSGLLQPTVEDADTASTRRQLLQQKDNIAWAICVLKEHD